MRGKAILSALLLLAALSPIGCGGGGGAGVAVDTSVAPLNFAFTPPGPMAFSVDFSTESEFRGTAFISSIRYRWEAGDWQRAGEGWTCDVTFKDISAAMRRGSGIGMETIREFDQLEGFSLRYRKDAAGFEPLVEPTKTPEFMALFGQLQAGLGALDLPAPAEPVRPGQSWEEADRDGSLDMIRGAMQDSVTTYTYQGDELLAGHACARIRFESKVPLDGVVEPDQGPQAGGKVRMTGKIESGGTQLMDKAGGFLRSVEGKSKIIINQRPLDEKGKPSGAEQSLVQNLNFKIKYLGD